MLPTVPARPKRSDCSRGALGRPSEKRLKAKSCRAKPGGLVMLRCSGTSLADHGPSNQRGQLEMAVALRWEGQILNENVDDRQEHLMASP